jgi:hypothetical protein
MYKNLVTTVAHIVIEARVAASFISFASHFFLTTGSSA